MSDSDMSAPSEETILQTSPAITALEEAVNDLLSEELGYFLDDSRSQDETSADNKRNGYYYRIFKTPIGDIHIRVPRDRNGEFHPHILPKKHSIIPSDQSSIFSLFFSEPSDDEIIEAAESFYDSDYSPEAAESLKGKLFQAIKSYHEHL